MTMSSEKSRGKQAGRMLEMLAAMMSGDRLNSRSASERFGMNPEGALRNLKLLHKLVPGVAKTREGARDVFSFDPKELLSAASLPDAKSSLASAIAVSMGAAFSRVFAGTQYQIDLRRLRDEVVQRLATAWKQRFVSMSRKFVVLSGHEEELEDRAGLLEDVLDAVLRQRLIRMRYRKFSGEEDETVVEPYSLVVYDAHLYVLGNPVRADGAELHPYRFARIQTLEVLDKTFTYPEPIRYDPAVLFRDSIGIWTGDPAPCAIRVRLSPLWSVYARHHRWHQSQRIVAEHPGGSVEIEMRVRPCPEFEQWVLRFGEHAEVLAPESLRKTLRQRSDALAAIYAKKR
jgi:predicted DNA-binding transcriptional regulator YafY